jgi:hypothetical protein
METVGTSSDSFGSVASLFRGVGVKYLHVKGRVAQRDAHDADGGRRLSRARGIERGSNHRSPRRLSGSSPFIREL